MFEFLFKRQGSGKSAASGEQPGKGKPGAATPGGPAAAGKAAPAPDNRAALADAKARQAEQLERLDGNEAAAVDFILASEFSELRLAAAERLHGREHLERVHGAMRNTDRRVAKLVQARLDAIRHAEAELRRGQEALAQARSLLGDLLLTPNHVAELDRKWSVIRAPELVAEFDAVRAELGGRLASQVQLQRAMIDRLAAMRQLASNDHDAATLAARLAALRQEQDAALVDPGHASLPRALVAEFETEHARLTAGLATLEQDQAALRARGEALDGWGAQAPAELKADQLRKDWQRLPALPAGPAGDALQQRFNELLATLPSAPRKTAPATAAATGAATGVATTADRQPRAAREGKGAGRGADQSFLDNLDALDAALQQGSLGSAADLDKALKDAKDKGVRLTPAQSDRLAHLRAELKRLSDWARWGGNVSREELIKAVDSLPAQNLAMAELARKVGSMRDRWKALDSLSGPAPRSLWERFDAACSTAYAPAAAHFRGLADERHANAVRGQALVEEARGEIARLQSGEADWKHVSGTVQRLRTAWSHLGAVDRKEKKRLDTEFAEALTTLQRPLEDQRRVEIAVREQLIEEVGKLDPHERHAVDMLRELQGRWQEHARALPLERKAEQALWQRFRAACDALFAARKEQASAADSERRGHEEAKEAICARLEAAAPDATPATAGKLLREAAAEWQAIGPVPRAHEARIDKRYQAAVAQVHQHADAVRRAQELAQAGSIRDKLRLIHALEAALADPDAQVDAADWRRRWEALVTVDGGFEPVLQARFDAALGALDDGRAAYAQQLAVNQERLHEDLLRLEIAAGIDSGAEFARERLRLQVEVLQSSLKSGNRPGAQSAGLRALRALLALPASADARTQSRIEHLLLSQPKGAR